MGTLANTDTEFLPRRGAAVMSSTPRPFGQAR
jgi:hypothetical protein